MRLDPYLSGQKLVWTWSLTNDLKMVSIDYGRSKNYVGGSYDFEKAKGEDDLFICNIIDLESGATISRKSIHKKASNIQLNYRMTKFNTESGKFVFAIQSASGGLNRKVKFAVFEP